MLEEGERVGGGNSVCVCAPAGQSCSLCVSQGSAVLFSPLHEVSGQPSGERRGEEWRGAGGKGERREKEEKGRKIMEERERERGGQQ